MSISLILNIIGEIAMTIFGLYIMYEIVDTIIHH